MMHLFILSKTLLQVKPLNPYSLLSLLAILFSLQAVHAEPVQRWQDSKGQWHFGDQAAAIGQKTQPVLIKNPISVIKNDATPNLSHVSTTSKSQKGIGKSKRKNPQQTSHGMDTSHKQQCDTLREQVYRQPVPAKASQVRQNLVRHYEQNCIAGNYYGH